MTYKEILQRTLARVDDKYNKNEGEIIFDAIAPFSFEHMLMHIEFQRILNETFADTASREFLIRRCWERGITPYPATYATFRGVFTPSNLDLIGRRFNMSASPFNYVVTERFEDGTYKVQCETPGADGNGGFGNGFLIPIEFIDGLQSARLSELLVPGENEEDTESLRQRYISSFNIIAFGGNRADYLEKIRGIPGVGGVKLERAWNGGGTVRIVVTDANHSTPSSTLVDEIQTAVDPTVNQGEGLGFAPIDHTVTVMGATKTNINIGATFTFFPGYDFNSQRSALNTAVAQYLSVLAQDWENQFQLVVRASQILTVLLGVTGVQDVTGVTVNGKAQNLPLNQYAIPVFGRVDSV